jgi:hypothetical protein
MRPSWKAVVVTALAAALAGQSVGIAAPSIIRAEWETGPVECSHSLAISHGELMLGETDAIATPREDELFVRVVVGLAGMNGPERCKTLFEARVEDAEGERYEPALVHVAGTWRAVQLIDPDLRWATPEERAPLLFSVPYDSRAPYVLVAGGARLPELDRALGEMPPKPEPQTRYCIFDELALREAPHVNFPATANLRSGQEVEQARTSGHWAYVKTSEAEGWAPRSGFVATPEEAESAASHEPPLRCLVVLSEFTGPDSFECEIAHGRLEATAAKRELNPGDCIVLTSAAAGSYTGPVEPFGYRIEKPALDAVYVLGADAQLVRLLPGGPLSGRLGAIIAVGVGALALAGVAAAISGRRRRSRRQRTEPEEAPRSEEVPAAAAEEEEEEERTDIRVECGECGASYTVPRERAGQTGRCRCGHLIPVRQAARDRPGSSRQAASAGMSQRAASYQPKVAVIVEPEGSGKTGSRAAEQQVESDSQGASKVGNLFPAEYYAAFVLGVLLVGGLGAIPLLWSTVTELSYLKALPWGLASSAVFLVGFRRDGTISWARLVAAVIALTLAAVLYSTSTGRPSFGAGGVVGFLVMVVCGYVGVGMAKLFRRG